MNYKSYICGSCKYKDICLTEPEEWPAYSVPICKCCNDGSKYEPKAAKPPISPVTMNTGEFTKALKKTLNSVYGVKSTIYIKKVLFNEPATIIFWSDDTKTVVKCGKDDVYDPEKGLAMAIAKKALGNEGNYYNAFKKILPKEDSSEETESFYTDGKPGADE